MRALVLFGALAAARELVGEVAAIEHPGQAVGHRRLAQAGVEPGVVERREQADGQRLQQVAAAVPLARGGASGQAEGAPQVALVAERKAAPGAQLGALLGIVDHHRGHRQRAGRAVSRRGFPGAAC